MLYNKIEFFSIRTIIFHYKLYSCNEAFHCVDQETYIETVIRLFHFDMKKVNNYWEINNIKINKLNILPK